MINTVINDNELIIGKYFYWNNMSNKRQSVILGIQWYVLFSNHFLLTLQQKL